MAGPAYYTGAVNIAKNEDWAVPFVYSAVGTDGVTLTPIDLTGSVLKFEIRKQETDFEATVASFSSDLNLDGVADGIYITDPLHGMFTLVVTRAQSARLTPGDYVCDLVRLMPSGYQERLWEGTATVVQGTTR